MAEPLAVGARAVAAELLAFYREPVRHRPAYLHGERALPDGAVVFRAALGRHPNTWLRELSDAERDELRFAALAFVRQVCLWERATHYQVLCLDPSAARADVKEHYHLLMALLHPDRQEASPEAWPSGCAQRVNAAHDTLADARLRAAYDADLGKASERFAFEAAIAGRGAFGRRARSRPAASTLGFARGFILLTGVVAALLGIQAWWAGELSPQHGLLERSFSQAPAWGREGLPDSPRFLGGGPIESGDRLEPLKEPGRLAALASWVPFAGAAPTAAATSTPAPAEQGLALATATALATQSAPPAAEPAPRATESAARATERAQESSPSSSAPAQAAPFAAAPAAVPPQSVPVAQAAQPAARVAQAQSIPSPAAAPATPPGAPTRDQVEGVVAYLVSFYEAGDADGLIGLFDADELGWLRGYRIRGAYADFFSATRTRRLKMERLVWRNEGLVAMARGEATLTAEYPDGRPHLERRVPVEIDIALRGGKARIMRLVLFPGNG